MGGLVNRRRMCVPRAVAVAVIVYAGFGAVAQTASAAAPALYTSISPQAKLPTVEPIPESELPDDTAPLGGNADVSQQYTTVFGRPENAVYAYPATRAYSGMSAAAVVAHAGVPTSKLVTMTVSDRVAAQNRPVVLSPRQVFQGFNHPNAVDSSPSQALFLRGSLCLAFLRPMDFPGDDNVPDSFQCSVSPGARDDPGINVDLEVSGPVLEVGGIPDPKSKSVHVGQSVSFTAPQVKLDGVRVTSGLSYHWDFGGGLQDDHANPNVRYSVAGTYGVRVTVTDADGNSGVSPNPIIMSVDVPQGQGDANTPGDQGKAPTGGGIPEQGTSTGARVPGSGPASVRPGAVSEHTTAKQKAAAAAAKRAQALRLASGGSGGTGGSGSAGGASGGRSGAGGLLGAEGRTPGALTRRQDRSPANDTTTQHLVGLIVDSGTALAEANESTTSHTVAQLAAARSSRGSGATARWIGRAFQGAVLVIVLALGGVFEFRPGALYRKILTS